MRQSSTERVTAVDTLRGVALAGMLAVHFQYYAEGPEVWADRVQAMVDLLFTTRFYALFAFLFGVGFALQVERGGDRPGFVRIYARRLLALAVFALMLHGITGYHVLLDYAFWGFALLLIRRWSTRALVALAIAIIVLSPVVVAVQWQVESRTIGVTASNEAVREGMTRWPTYHRVEDELRASGDFSAVIAHRLSFALGAFKRWQHYIPGGDTLMFVFGLLAVRIGVLRRPAEHRRLLWTVLIVAGVLGLASNIPPQLSPRFAGESLRLRMAWNAVQWGIANEMFLGLAYGAAVLLWISRPPTFPTAATLLAFTGRMSLTNYVVQVSMLELVFAVGGVKITRPVALLATAAFFLFQIAYSRWWLQRYRMGPLEWLWRSVTYWRLEPLRLPQSVDVVSV